MATANRPLNEDNNLREIRDREKNAKSIEKTSSCGYYNRFNLDF